MARKMTVGNSMDRFWKKWFRFPWAEKSPLKDDALEDVLNSLDLAIIYFDATGKLKTANCQACRLVPELGNVNEKAKACDQCPLDNQCGNSKKKICTLQDFISYVFDKSVDAHDQSGLVLETKAGRNSFREIIEMQDGRYYMVRAVPQKSSGTIVELTDISLIKSRNDDLSLLGEQNQILMEAIQTSKVGIFVAENKTRKRKILFINQALSSLLGGECKNFLGKPLFSFCNSQFKGSCEQLKEIIEKNQREHIWKRHIKENGEEMWLEIDLYPTGIDNSLLIGFFSDQTQAKKQENRLRQTQKLEAIGQLAGGIAHDFNNILAIMEGYTRMTEGSWKNGCDISANIEKLYQTIKRGSGLTRQLLTFGNYRIAENQTIDLCKCVEEAKNLLVPLLGEKVELEMEIDDCPIYVNGTPDIITQIIMNLSINARDATQNGGKISINLSKTKTEKGNYVVLSISDTGIGMTRETMDRIFDPFFTTKEQGKGTGLGLWTVYGLVQQMKGEISVESEVGKGTVFRLEFPESDDVPECEIPKLDKNDCDNQDKILLGRTVMIAEDEPDLLNIMCKALEEFGMKVLKASNGNEALEIQDEYVGEIDFLLTDMVMPKLGGLKLAELFKEVRPDTRIVYMSGYPVRGEISEIDLPDDVVFLAKPIMQENLKEIMAQVARGQNVKPAVGTVWE